MKLEELATVRTGVTSQRLRASAPRDNERDSTETFGLVHSRHLERGSIACAEPLNTTRAAIRKYLAIAGDVLLVIRGMQFKAAWVDPETVKQGLVVASELAIIRPRDRAIGVGLFAYLDSEPGRRALNARMHTSTTVRSLKVKDLRALPVPRPGDASLDTIRALVVTRTRYVQSARAAINSRVRATEIALEGLLGVNRGESRGGSK